MVALLCLVVVAFAAATIDTTTNEGTGFGSLGPADNTGGQDEQSNEERQNNGTNPSPLDLDLGGSGAPLTVCVEWLTTAQVQLALLAGLTVVVGGVQYFRDWMAALGTFILIAYPGGIVYFLLTSCRTNQGLLDLGGATESSQSEGGGLVGGETAVPQPSLSTQLLLVGLFLLLVVVAAIVLTSDHDQRTEDTNDQQADINEEVADMAAIGAAAGRAADRLEYDGEFENEIYRAWAEMTESLTVEHPESSTPAEFATAAVEAGMTEDDVERLTELFAGVRYGDASVTEEREQEAIDILRRIESAYGDESA